jgi:hypothetical protein
MAGYEVFVKGSTMTESVHGAAKLQVGYQAN